MGATESKINICDALKSIAYKEKISEIVFYFLFLLAISWRWASLLVHSMARPRAAAWGDTWENPSNSNQRGTPFQPRGGINHPHKGKPFRLSSAACCRDQGVSRTHLFGPVSQCPTIRGRFGHHPKTATCNANAMQDPSDHIWRSEATNPFCSTALCAYRQCRWLDRRMGTRFALFLVWTGASCSWFALCAWVYHPSQCHGRKYQGFLLDLGVRNWFWKAGRVVPTNRPQPHGNHTPHSCAVFMAHVPGAMY